MLSEKAVKIAQRAGSLYGGGHGERAWGQALARLDPLRYDQAERHLAESVRLFEDGDARVETARTHVAWGRVLRERGEIDQAGVHFEKAVAQFEASDLARELEETRALMREGQAAN